LNLLPPPSDLPPDSTAWTYLRDSGGEGQDRSIPRQLEAVRAYCAQHRIRLVHVFKDEAKSGTTTAGRDDFNRLYKLAIADEDLPDGLLLWNYARFSRDLDDSQFYKSSIRRQGIIIHSLTDPVPEGPYARFVETLIDISNEERSRQTSVDAKDGLRSIVMQGAVPGTPPRGFKREPILTVNPRTGEQRTNHRWVVNKKTAPRVRKAFKMRASGATLREIHLATRLYGAINSYKTFFTNPIYIGILEFGDMVIENYCEPLIDMKTWAVVQEKIVEHAQKKYTDKHPRRVNSVYLLSGLIKCAKCGSPMNGNTVSRDTSRGRDEAYRCSRAKRRLDCDARRIPRWKIEDEVIKVLAEYILIPESIAAHQEIALKNQSQGTHEREEQKDALTEENIQLSRAIANITKAIADAGHSDALLDALKLKEIQRTRIRTELDELNIPIERVPHLTPEQIGRASKSLIHALNHSPPEQLRQLLRGIIHEVVVEREGKIIRGMITYHYPPPFDSAPIGTLPMQPTPVGALLHRQLFSQPFEIKPRS
jgi:site-specific DNA recombinase